MNTLVRAVPTGLLAILAALLVIPGGVMAVPSPVQGRYAYEINFDLEGHLSGTNHRERRRSGRGVALDTWDCATITEVPDDILTSFPLNSFYQKYTHAYGVPIVSSNVSLDAALTRACYTVRFLLADRKDIRDSMYDRYGRVAVIAETERTTQIPEHSYLDSTLWDDRARGLGGTLQVPVSTDGEENILCYSQRDRWFEEDVLVHEFAHAIHLISLETINASFTPALRNVYEMAKADNLWSQTYAITKHTEYFAEGVQSFFDVQTCRTFFDGIHNEICTRDALMSYDERLYDLIVEVFPCLNTIVDRCASDRDLASNQSLRMNCDTVEDTTTDVGDTTTDVEDTTTDVEDTTTDVGDTTTDVGDTTTDVEDTTTDATTDAFTDGVTDSVPPKRFCLEVSIVVTSVGPLTWPTTVAGERSQSNEKCPLTTQKAGFPKALRICSVVDGPVYSVWGDYEIQECGTTKDVDDITVEDIVNVTVSAGNVLEVAQFLANVTVVEPGVVNVQPRHNLSAVSQILENIVAVESGDTEVTDAVLQTVNNVIVGSTAGQVLGKDERNSYSSIIKSLEAQVALTLRQEDTVSLRQDSVQVEAVSVDPAAANRGLGFESVQRDSEEGSTGSFSFEETEIKQFVGQIELANELASVQLPRNVLDYQQSDDAGDNTNLFQLRISYIVYRDDTLFRSALIRRSTNPRLMVGGVVVSLNVQDVVLENLTDPVVVQFKAPNDKSGDRETLCVFWDFSLEQGVGDWSQDGCVKAAATSDTVVCHCNHLGNFAILVSMTDTIPPAPQPGLHVISQIGCALSVAFLAVSLIVYICIRKLRDSKPGQIFINFCFSILMLFVVFLAGIDGAKDSEGGCVFVAAFLHYLSLTTMMWMAVEARDIYVSAIKGFQEGTPRFIISACLVAWGSPLVVLVITLPAAFSFYQINGDGGSIDKSYCFLKVGLAMYLGLLLPIGLILVHNFTAFILAKRRLPKVEDEPRSKLISIRLQNAAVVSVLVILTLVFGFLAIDSTAFAFQLIFFLVISTLGVVVFIMFCVRREEVQSALMPYLRHLHCPDGQSLRGKYALRGKNATSDRKFSESSANKANALELSAQVFSTITNK